VSITEKTRKEDEKLREKLRHVDPAKLKKVIKALVVPHKVGVPKGNK
jgi:hypothetical protein